MKFYLLIFMEVATVRIARKQLNHLAANSVKSAEAVNLEYVNDSIPGITRAKEQDDFVYYFNNKKVTDKKTLERIKKLVIPPAWEKVWISPIPNGHIQATGFDLKNRKQYKYHALWSSLRSQTKYAHLYEFGKALPGIRKKLQHGLSLPGLQLEKVLAAVVSIMQCTCIRIGSNEYEKLYGSFGLTTLKDKHVSFDKGKAFFSFKGKKGVYHNITLKSKKLAKIVQQCRDIPGKELFQYYTDDGERKSIDSGMVNNYIKEISGGNFTAKDFRTWAGSLQALETLKDTPPASSATEAKKRIVEILDIVAGHLGNTRTVCKKYYVHPSLLEHYTNGTLDKYLKQIDAANCSDVTGHTPEETVLMKILAAGKEVVIE